MSRKWYRSIVSLGMALSLVLLSTSPALASTGADLKTKINNLAKKKTQANNTVSSLNSKIKSNQSKQKSIQQQLADLQSQIVVAWSHIHAKEATISKTKNEIATLNGQIADVKSRISKRDQLLKARVKAMYETSGSNDTIQLLLSANNFADFVSRVLALNTIASNDQHILTQQKQDKLKLDQQQSDVQTKLTSLQKDLKQLSAMNQSIQKQKKEQQALLTKLQTQAKTLEKEKFSQQEIATNLAKEQAATQKAYDLWKQEQARKARSRSNSSTNSSALMSWPIVGGKNHITSPYGYRTFLNEFHHGIDIGVPEGTPIHAAASGVVFRAYPSSSYGNVVMLTSYINGQEYTTVYAHENHYIVHGGETVHKGDVIGYVGHTGQAFGSHLHFAVYKGNWTPPPHPNTIDPMSVLP